MDIKDLMSGIGIIIDDQIGDPSANVQKIIEQINDAQIPLLKYDRLLKDAEIKHLHSISFLILDWSLTSLDLEEMQEGVQLPSGIVEANTEENLAFLDKIHEKCYNPIFIFTNEEISEIKEILYTKYNLSDEKTNNLFILHKNDLEEGQLFQKIEEWINENPSIYLLKEWEMQYKRGKYDLFTQFYEYSAYWPNILWENFEKDGANCSLEMSELLIRNLKSRLAPFDFEASVLSRGIEDISPKELQAVLEADRFISIDFMHVGEISTGDLFTYSAEGETRYYLNIRAQCDIARDKNPKLYLLKGRVLTKDDEGQYSDFNSRTGSFDERNNNCIVPFVAGGKIIEFLLRELVIKKWSEVENDRIGKILPPYITNVQQKYAAYHQRQGLPRIPDKALESM